MSAAPQQMLEQAQELHRAGRLTEAGELYRRILAVEPNHADALHYLGVIELQGGAPDKAEAMIRRAIELKPAEPAAHVNLGRALRRLARFDEAAEAYRAATVLDSGRVSAWIGLSESLSARRRSDEALQAALRAIALDAASAAARYCAGVAAQLLGRDAEAEDFYRAALARDPKLAEAHNDLGVLLLERGAVAAAVGHFEAAVAASPALAAAHNNLGKAQHQAGAVEAGLRSFERALELDPDYAAAFANAAAALRELGRLDEARQRADRALVLDPGGVEAQVNLALILRDLGLLDDALARMRGACAAAPDRPELQTTLGMIANDCGLHREALAATRRAVTLAPDRVEAWRNLLGVMLYNSALSEAERWEAHRAFGASMTRAAAGASPSPRGSGETRLRIGYVSSDFRPTHPVSRNLSPVLRHRDRVRFETIAYSDTPPRAGEPMRDLADRWRPTAGQSDAQLAETIRADGIDILLLLAGRFDRNRPQLAAWRAAPVQVSFHDPATSGLAEMDYLIADPALVPRGGGEHFSERVVRLPGFYIHDPIATAPAIGPPPCGAAGAITFGCFNNLAKLSDLALATWARVLRQVPGSRLALKFRGWYAAAAIRDRILALLAEGGVASDRIEFITAGVSAADHLAAYNRIDIALDPFPFAGSTTSFEALWMGVPVVTLAGDAMVGRWGLSLLRTAGLPELAAADIDAYVALAARLAGDTQGLAQLRAGLRKRVEQSSLCNGPARARQLERLYRALWRNGGRDSVKRTR